MNFKNLSTDELYDIQRLVDAELLRRRRRLCLTWKICSDDCRKFTVKVFTDDDIYNVIVRKQKQCKRQFVVYIKTHYGRCKVQSVGKLNKVNLIDLYANMIANLGIHTNEFGQAEFNFQRLSRKCAIMLLALKRRKMLFDNFDKFLVERIARIVFSFSELRHLRGTITCEDN